MTVEVTPPDLASFSWKCAIKQEIYRANHNENMKMKGYSHYVQVINILWVKLRLIETNGKKSVEVTPVYPNTCGAPGLFNDDQHVKL